MRPACALLLRRWLLTCSNRHLSTHVLSDRESETVSGERCGRCDKLSRMAESRETTSLLEKIKASKTPFLDALSEKEQVFVRTYYATDNQSRAATRAGYSRQNGNRLIAKPRIKAALFEQHQLARVHSDPTRAEVIGWLAFEATYSLNPASVRVQAQKTLADIKGMTGGGGNDGDSALDEFFKRAGRAVASGVFEGAKDAGRKAVSQPEPEPVEVDAKSVGEGENLAGAFELPPGERA